MLPTSLPGAIFGGITAARPTSPRAARRSSVGVDATSSGVRPPSPAIGSSEQPSGTQITYFTAVSLAGGRDSQVSRRPWPPTLDLDSRFTSRVAPGRSTVGDSSGTLAEHGEQVAHQLVVALERVLTLDEDADHDLLDEVVVERVFETRLVVVGEGLALGDALDEQLLHVHAAVDVVPERIGLVVVERDPQIRRRAVGALGDLLGRHRLLQLVDPDGVDERPGEALVLLVGDRAVVARLGDRVDVLLTLFRARPTRAVGFVGAGDRARRQQSQDHQQAPHRPVLPSPRRPAGPERPLDVSARPPPVRRRTGRPRTLRAAGRSAPVGRGGRPGGPACRGGFPWPARPRRGTSPGGPWRGTPPAGRRGRPAPRRCPPRCGGRPGSRCGGGGRGAPRGGGGRRGWRGGRTRRAGPPPP